MTEPITPADIPADADPLAALTRPELGHLAGMMYRAFNRLCDAAEADLAEQEAYAPRDPAHARLQKRAVAGMSAMSEIHHLHTEITGRLAATARTGN